MKRFCTLALILLLCLTLSACGHEHQWQDATCATPKTCAQCGKTEGEPLGHSWADATCAAPKTCALCGKTEGEPLPHGDLTEANYQEPAKCTVCGEAVGEPLTADFLKYNQSYLDTSNALGGLYYYETACSTDTHHKTHAKTRVEDCTTIEADEDHPAMDGYEWKLATISLRFFDMSACDYGFRWRYSLENYYDIVGFSQAITWNSDHTEGWFSVNWHGSDYVNCICQVQRNDSGWIDVPHANGGHTTRESIVTFQFACRVPKGYDGIVIAFKDASPEWDNTQYIYDYPQPNVLMFRMD